MRIPEFQPILRPDETTTPRGEGIPPATDLLVITIIPQNHLAVDPVQELQNETVVDIHCRDIDVATRAQGPQTGTADDHMILHHEGTLVPHTILHHEGTLVLHTILHPEGTLVLHTILQREGTLVLHTILQREGTLVLHTPGPANKTEGIRDPLIAIPVPLPYDAAATLVLGPQETLTHAPRHLGMAHQFTLNAPTDPQRMLRRIPAHLARTLQSAIYKSQECALFLIQGHWVLGHIRRL